MPTPCPCPCPSAAHLSAPGSLLSSASAFCLPELPAPGSRPPADHRSLAAVKEPQPHLHHHPPWGLFLRPLPSSVAVATSTNSSTTPHPSAASCCICFGRREGGLVNVFCAECRYSLGPPPPPQASYYGPAAHHLRCKSWRCRSLHLLRLHWLRLHFGLSLLAQELYMADHICE
jgi:hypothetical protein